MCWACECDKAIGTPSAREGVHVNGVRPVAAARGTRFPGAIPGVGWSDHWAFWQEGYPALMATCTAPFRNPNYHKPTDTPGTLDHERMARVVEGLEVVVRGLAEGG